MNKQSSSKFDHDKFINDFNKESSKLNWMRVITITILLCGITGLSLWFYVGIKGIAIAPFNFENRMIYNKIENNHQEIMERLDKIEKEIKELRK